MERRDLLKLGAVAGVASALGLRPGGELSARVAGGDVPGRGRVRNVIFLAYDGTGYEDFATAEFFSRRVVGRPLRFNDLLRGGRTGTMIPSSLTSWVTDSAAATTAWSTGRKVVNGALSMYPDGRELATIFDLARDRGLATGLVTSARITHATPGGWGAKVAHRDNEAEIAEQYLTGRVDVLLGGGRGPFFPASRLDGRDLPAEYRAAGYDVVTTAEELERASASRILGIFTPGLQHLPYEVDRLFQGHPAPSLAHLTQAALDRLDGAENGFILQVEAGRIDHANHNNDPGALIRDWMAADETLEVLLEFVDGRDDTLLLFACDHDTGGGVAYGWGSGYRNSNPGLMALAEPRASYEWLLREILPRNPDPGEVQAAVREHLRIPLDDTQSEQISAILSGANPRTMRWGHRNAHGGAPNDQMAQVLSQSPTGRPDRPSISFATANHTAGFVPCVIYGAGTPPGNLGVVDNTELFDVMTSALGITHQNPIMTEEEARALTGG